MEFKKKTIIWESNNQPPKNYIGVKEDGKAYEGDAVTKDGVESNISFANTHSGEIITNGYEYVDLGLPSGTLWATKNVGATNVEDAGNQYAYGEIEPKDTYTQANYKFGNGSNFTKYTQYGPNADFKLILDLEDDAACVNGGGDGKTPQLGQGRELFTTYMSSGQTHYSYVDLEGNEQKHGIYVISKANGNSIFFPIPEEQTAGPTFIGYQASYLTGSNYGMFYPAQFGFTSSTSKITVDTSISQNCYGRYNNKGYLVRPVIFSK